MLVEGPCIILPARPKGSGPQHDHTVTQTKRDRSGRAALAIGWSLLLFVVLFWRLGAATFWDPDEAHYAQTTVELIASGDWLAPYFNERPFFDKPVLFYLLQAIPMSLLGATEGAARLVPALAALAIVGVTWWLGVTLGSARVGLVAALLLTVNPALFALTRYAILDTVFTAFLFGGVAMLAVAALHDRPRLQYGGYVLIAFATLTKGPLAIVLAGLAFAISILVSADARRRLLGLRWVLGLAIVAGLATPWFVYMWLRFRDAFIQGYVLNENVRLFAESMYQGQPPWWFYIQLVLVGMLPWTGLIVGRLYDDLRARSTPLAADTFEVLLWSWIGAIVVFFSFSSFKLDHYVFPAAPALCLVAARAWSGLGRDAGEPTAAGVRLGARLMGPTLMIAGAASAFLMLARLGLPSAALVVPGALGCAGALVTRRSWARTARVPTAPWITLTALGVTYAGLLFWVVPALEQRKVVPEIARWVAAAAGPGDRVCSYGLNRWQTAFRFYVGRHVDMLDVPEQARQWFAEPGPVFCATTAEAYHDLVALELPLRVVHSREGLWATSGESLWQSAAPLTRFLVVARRD
jgi:4-amino-4-deoxy-L-arabinose transferase-like glycosyltransferase